MLVLAALNLLTIPAVIHFSGAAGWTAIAVGQNIGMMAALLTGLGWSTLGPTHVSSADPPDRPHIFLRSLISRFWTLPVTVPAAIVACRMLAPSNTDAAAIMALSFLAAALGATWYFIGVGSSVNLILFDTLPRALGIALGTVLLYQGASVEIFAVSQLAGALAGVAVSSTSILSSIRGGWRSNFAWTTTCQTVKSQLTGTFINVASSVYWTLPLLLITGVSPQAAAQFAFADRLKQYATVAITPMAQVLQGWTPSSSISVRIRRVKLAVGAAVVLGVVGGVGFSVLSPSMTHLLGASVIGLGVDVSMPMGVVFGLNATALVIGTACLFTMGRTVDVLMSTIVGSVIVIPAVLFLAAPFGAAGGAWGVAAAQLGVLAYQSVALLRSYGRWRINC